MSVSTNQGVNVYHKTSNKGCLHILQSLVMHNNDYVKGVDKMNCTPLYHAVFKGHIEIVNYLLRNKADVTDKIDQDWNISCLAASKGYFQILQALVMHNNDYVNNVDTINCTPLYYAVSEGHLEIVNYLLSNKADVSVSTNQGINVYHKASNKGYLHILQSLIMHNNDYVNVVDKKNWTPLYHATFEGHTEIVNYMLRKKADVTVKTDKGWNVYHLAARKGYMQILQALIMHNIDYVNDVDKMNWTPLLPCGN